MHVHVNRVLRLCVWMDGCVWVYGVRVCVYGEGSGWMDGLYEWVGCLEGSELMGLYVCGM